MIDKLVEKLLDAIKIVLMNGFKMIVHANEHVERKIFVGIFSFTEQLCEELDCVFVFHV